MFDAMFVLKNGKITFTVPVEIMNLEPVFFFCHDLGHDNATAVKIAHFDTIIDCQAHRNSLSRTTWLFATSFPGSLILPPNRASEERP